MGIRSWTGWRITAAGAALLSPAVAAAQQGPAQVPAATPQLPSRAQVEQPAPPLASATNARVAARGAVPAAPCPLADSPLRVTLTAVKFVAAGRDALPPAIAKALEGADAVPPGEQALAVVCTIRDRANAALARAGFIASVQVPPQEISGGVLTLSVVLARIVEVRVHGEPGPYRAVLATTIDRLRALDPLNERDAERVLLLAGDVPGLDVQLALRPAGSAPGDVIGDLNVATRRVNVIANVQNYGSRSLGRETGYARVELNSVFTGGDSLYLGGSLTGQIREQQIAQAGYRTIVTPSGLTVGPRLTYAWSRPDVGTLDLRSRSIIAGLDVTQPLVRSVRRNLSTTLGFEAIEQRVRIYDPQGSSPLNLDRLREVFARLDGRMSERRPDGLDAVVIGGSLEVRKGLDILSASRRGQLSPGNYTPSRFEGDPLAWVVRGSLTEAVRFDRIFSVSGSALGQWANHPLLNFDEQALGNLTVGLGYDPGSNSADRLLGLHLEGRADIGTLRNLDLQLFAFTDQVRIWNLDSFSTENNRLLRSVGGGVRVRLPGPMLLELTYARPLDRALSIDKARAPARLLFSLTAQLSPNLP